MTDITVYPPNDVGSGQRLADRFGGELRWVTDSRCWVIYDGARWEVQPDDVKVEGIAKKAALLIADEAASITDNDDRRRVHLQFAARSRDMVRIRAAVAAAKSEPSIQVRLADLDTDPLLINCANGTFDLRSDRLRDHDPEDLITKVVPHAYVAGAYAPRWSGLLRRATMIDPSGATAEYLEMVLGYSIVGGNPEQQIFFVIGAAGTGKSQVVEIPVAVLGPDYAWNGRPSIITQGKNEAHTEEIVKLGQKRLLIINETDNSMLLDEAAVKAITGSKSLPVRSLYGKQEQVPLLATIVVVTNEAPAIAKFDDAIARRIKIIPSGPALAPHEKDIGLQRKIVAEEADGVLASLINGARRWYARSRGVGAAESQNDVAVFDRYTTDLVESETMAFNYEADPIIAFMDQCLEFGPEWRAPKPRVDEAFTRFAGRSGRVGRNRFFARLLDLCEQRGLVEVHKDARNFYGLRVRSALHAFDGR